MKRKISVGDSASALSELVSVPVGEGFLGRIVNSLAELIDGKGKIKHSVDNQSCATALEFYNSPKSLIDKIQEELEHTLQRICSADS